MRLREKRWLRSNSPQHFKPYIYVLKGE